MEVFGDQHAMTLQCGNQLAVAYTKAGKFQEGRARDSREASGSSRRGSSRMCSRRSARCLGSVAQVNDIVANVEYGQSPTAATDQPK